MFDCHSGTVHWCKGFYPLPVQQAGLIMTRRSEIITCIRTNTAIPQLSEQLSLSLLQQIVSRPCQLVTFQIVSFDFFQGVLGFYSLL